MRHHLSDHDLVLAFDGELTATRHAAVDAHLSDCLSCRARQAELAQTSMQIRAVDGSALEDADRTAASREALRFKLAAVAREQEASLVHRFAGTFGRPLHWAAVVGVAAAVVLLVKVAQGRDGRLVGATASAVEDGALPVAALTPGATWDVSVAEVCSPAGREQRQVADSTRAAVLRRYGMQRVPAEEYELDFLITPELGGAPTAQNLWPQRYASRIWNARVKDQLEQRLPGLVCNGAISLQAAQHDIAADWIAAYKKYFHTDTPIRLQAELEPEAQQDDLVYPIWRSGRSPQVRLVSFSAAR